MATSTGLTVRVTADKTSGDRLVRLRVPSGGWEQFDDGSIIVDPELAERILHNPATPGCDHEPWPFAGIEFEGDPPKVAKLPTRWVTRAVAAGWATLENPRPAFYPKGPADDPWKETHTIMHADAIILNGVDGPVRYEVVHQPGKYVGDTGHDEAGEEHAGSRDTRVDWFYDVKLDRKGA